MRGSAALDQFDPAVARPALVGPVVGDGEGLARALVINLAGVETALGEDGRDGLRALLGQVGVFLRRTDVVGVADPTTARSISR